MLRSSTMPRSATAQRPHRRPGLPAVLVSTFIALQLLNGAPPTFAAEGDELPASLLEAQRMGLHPTPPEWLGAVRDAGVGSWELLPPLPPAGPPPDVDLERAARIAAARARWEWGASARIASVLPILDAAGRLTAYDVDVTLDGSTFGTYNEVASAWQELIKRAEADPEAFKDVQPPWATVVVSAADDHPPIACSRSGPSSFFSAGWMAAGIATRVLGTTQVTLEALIMLGSDTRLYEFTSGSRTILVEAEAPWAWGEKDICVQRWRANMDASTQDLRTRIEAGGKTADAVLDSLRVYYRSCGDRWIRGDYEPMNVVFIAEHDTDFIEEGMALEATDAVLSMVMNYYDERFLYGALVTSYRSYYNTHWGHNYCHTPDLDFAWRPLIEYNRPETFHPAMLAVAAGKGYAFTPGVNTSGNILDWRVAAGKDEIDASYPFVWTDFVTAWGSHFTYTVVGYDTTPEPDEWLCYRPVNLYTLNQGLRRESVIPYFPNDVVHYSGPHPGGEGYTTAEIATLDGNQDYWGCGPAGAIPAHDYYTIRWEQRGVPGDHVTIDLSTDGGANWTELAHNYPDLGWYSWFPSCGASNTCRIRILQYDAQNELVSGDGSYGNFAITDPVCGVPQLVSPAPGATCVSPRSGTLDWYGLGCADVYNVRLGTSCGSGTEYLAYTHAYSYTNLQPLTTYYWQVQSFNHCGQPQTWSSCRSFTTGPAGLASPALTSPADGATCVAGGGTLQWSAVSGATGYQLHLAMTSCQPSQWPIEVAGTSYAYTNLSPGTTYYWRVRTKDSCGNPGEWSACRSFTVAPVTLAAPTLLSPPDGTLIARTSGTLDWSDVPGAAAYRVRLGTSCGSGTVYTVTAPASQYDYSGLTNQTAYYWQVATKDNCNQWGAYSACFTFTTRDQATFTVRPDGTGTRPTIQAAINACINGDIVELTDGTFTGTGNRDLTYSGKAITVRSASGNPQACIIDCQGTPGVPHRGIAFNVGETAAAILDGVTIINGYEQFGGALHFNNTRPTINNCVFRQNYCSSSGGAIWLGNGAAPIFTNCDIYGNVSPTTGGGIHSYGATPTFTNCKIRLNNAATDGGGLYATYSSPVLVNTEFRGNSASDDGAGLCLQTNSTPHPTGCLFQYNIATDAGGAVFCGSASPIFSRCTFSENRAVSGGSIALTSSSTLTMDHSIVGFGTGGGAVSCDGTSHATLTCSDVYGNLGGDWTGCLAGQNGVNGNFSADPLLCNPALGDYHLHLDSPCAAANNPGCGQVGAYPVGCGPSQPVTVTVMPFGNGDYPTIQAALSDIPSGSTVVLTDGTYRGSGNRDLLFNGKAITLRSQSGNAAACIIDCQGSAAEPRRGFCFNFGEGPGTVIQGLTVRNGFAASEGGGLWFSSGGIAPVLRNCIFENCVSGGDGGAAFGRYNAHPTFENCIFRNNGAARYGGAVDFWTNCTPAFTGCTFEDNTATYGGAIDMYEGSAPTFQNCILDGNGATQGGAIYADTNCEPTFTRCTLYANEAPIGQARSLPIKLTPGAAASGRTPPDALLVGEGGGVYTINSTNIHLANSIIAFSAAGEAVVCYNDALATLTCTDVYQNAGGDWIGCIAGQSGVNGNFSADPQLCDPEHGVFTLRVDSPCTAANNPACGQVGAQAAGCGYHHLVNASGTGAYPTIQAAIDAIPVQDIVDLADGTYTGTGNRDLDFRGKKITVRSQSGDPTHCIIDCQGSAGSPHHGASFFRQEPAGTVLEGVTIINGYADTGPGISIAFSGTAPTIRNCRIHDCTAGTAGFGTVWIYDGAAPTIESCLIYMNSAQVGGGIAVTDATATIVNSTIADNQATTGPGIIQGPDGTITIRNSIVALNRGGPGVVCSGAGSVALTCSDVFGNTGGDWVGCIAGQAGQNGNIGLDPVFCDAADHDFTLRDISPCAPDHNPACGLIGSEPVACSTTGVPVAAPVIPLSLVLGPSMPNPFGDGTAITYGLPAAASAVPVRLAIYDAAGRHVRTLVDRDQAPGSYEVAWDGRGDDGGRLASGIYFARITAGGHVQTYTLVLAH